MPEVQGLPSNNLGSRPTSADGEFGAARPGHRSQPRHRGHDQRKRPKLRPLRSACTPSNILRCAFALDAPWAEPRKRELAPLQGERESVASARTASRAKMELPQSENDSSPQSRGKAKALTYPAKAIHKALSIVEEELSVEFGPPALPGHLGRPSPWWRQLAPLQRASAEAETPAGEATGVAGQLAAASRPTTADRPATADTALSWRSSRKTASSSRPTTAEKPASRQGVRGAREIPALERHEASVELLSTLTRDGVIVRGRLDEAAKAQRLLAPSVSKSQAGHLALMRVEQVQWRRNHQAFVERKQQQESLMVNHPDEDKATMRKTSPNKSRELPPKRDMTSPAFSDVSDAAAPNIEATSDQQLGVRHAEADGKAQDDEPAQTQVAITGSVSGGTAVLGDGTNVSDSAASSRKNSKEHLRTPNRRPSKSSVNFRSSRTLLPSEVASSQQAWGSTMLDSNNSQQQDGQASQPLSNRSKVSRRCSFECDNETRIERRDERRDFDVVMQMARKHQLSVEDVREKKEEFDALDKDRSGTLSVEELLAGLRTRCNLEPDEPIPSHLLSSTWASADKDSDGLVNFEEFLCWSISIAYSEEMLVTDPEERRMRWMARENGLLLPDVERVKDVFTRFDADGSGNIEEAEFRSVLHVLMNLKNPNDMSIQKMQRYWLEVDTNRSGTIEFDEFFLWYFTFFDM